jgi:ribosome recycling factor
MIDKVLADAEDRMKKSILAFRRELAGIRTGKATTTLLDAVKVLWAGHAAQSGGKHQRA